MQVDVCLDPKMLRLQKNLPHSCRIMTEEVSVSTVVCEKNVDFFVGLTF